MDTASTSTAAPLDFSGKTVVVIGASRAGIGSAIAAAFARQGADVSITGIEDAPSAADRGRYAYYQLDVSDQDATRALAAQFEHVDVVVNCAGIVQPEREFDADVFRRTIDVNLVGTLTVATAFQPLLAVSAGSIINIASTFTTFGSPEVPGYGASKAGVAQLTKSLAIRWAGEGVRVNCLAPGFITTAQTEQLRANEGVVDSITQRTPLGRWGRPDDLAGAALFLASPLAAFVTGIMLPVDGGYAIN